MRAFNKLNGWCRIAVVFSLGWTAVVIVLLLYERYMTLADATSQYAVLRAGAGNYNFLFFYATYTDGLNFHFYLRSQRFWTVLFSPIIISWAVAALAPAVAWARAGFGSTTRPSSGELGQRGDRLNPEVYRLLELMKQLAPDRDVSPDDHSLVSVYQARYMAKLMVVLAEEQEQAAAKMEQLTIRLTAQTDSLLRFTRGLYWLTAALLLLGGIQLILSIRCH